MTMGASGTLVAALRAEPDLVPSRGGRRSAALHRLLALADLTGALVAGVLAALQGGLSLVDSFVVGGASALSLPVLAFLSGLYAADDLRAWATGVPDLNRMLFASLALSWVLFAVAGLVEAPRPELVMLYGTILAFSLAASGRALARSMAHRSESLQERTVIVGSGVVAGELVDNLRRHREFGLVPVGVVEHVDHHRSVHGLPRLGALHELSDILGRDGIDRVIIAFSRASHTELLHVIRACRDNRVPVHIVPRLFEFLDGVRSLDHIGGMPILSLGVPRLTRVSHAAKRGFDIVGALFGLIALFPVFVALAIAIKRASSGPVLFKQVRGGRGGKTFELVKFRSMYEDADARKHELLHANEVNGGVMFKLRTDPRITSPGRLMRRYSLDELPQLWNVLRGEMSLVGPRPLVMTESESLYEDWHTRRNDLRPGMTGPWQIYGRSELSFAAMVRFDYQYVAGWSLARDLEILLATAPAVFSGRGAF